MDKVLASVPVCLSSAYGHIKNRVKDCLRRKSWLLLLIALIWWPWRWIVAVAKTEKNTLHNSKTRGHIPSKRSSNQTTVRYTSVKFKKTRLEGSLACCSFCGLVEWAALLRGAAQCERHRLDRWWIWIAATEVTRLNRIFHFIEVVGTWCWCWCLTVEVKKSTLPLVSLLFQKKIRLTWTQIITRKEEAGCS